MVDRQSGCHSLLHRGRALVRDFHRYSRARFWYAWLVVAALILCIELTTSIFVGSFAVDVFGTSGIRLVPIPEVAGLIIGLSGSLLIFPRLPSWEQTASRSLVRFALPQALLVLFSSGLAVAIVPFGLARDPEDVRSLAEWRIDTFLGLMPHSASAITLSACAIVVLSRYGNGSPFALYLLGIAVVTVAQTTELVGHWFPLAGSEAPQWSIYVLAVVASTVALVGWTRWGGAGLWDS